MRQRSDSDGDVLELSLGCISSTLGLAAEHPRYVTSCKEKERERDRYSSATSRLNISCLGVSNRDQKSHAGVLVPACVIHTTKECKLEKDERKQAINSRKSRIE